MISSSAVRGLRTRVTVFCGSSPRRRRRRRRSGGGAGGGARCRPRRRRPPGRRSASSAVVLGSSSSRRRPRRRRRSPSPALRRRRPPRRRRRRRPPPSPSLGARRRRRRRPSLGLVGLGGSAVSAGARPRRLGAASVCVGGGLRRRLRPAPAASGGRRRCLAAPRRRSAWPRRPRLGVLGSCGFAAALRVPLRRGGLVGLRGLEQHRRRRRAPVAAGLASAAASATLGARRPRPAGLGGRGLLGRLGGGLLGGRLLGGASSAAAFLRGRLGLGGCSAGVASAGASAGASAAAAARLGGAGLLRRRPSWRPSCGGLLGGGLLRGGLLARAPRSSAARRRWPRSARRRVPSVALAVVLGVVVVEHVLLLGPAPSAPGVSDAGDPQAQGGGAKPSVAATPSAVRHWVAGRHLPRSPGRPGLPQCAVTDPPAASRSGDDVHPVCRPLVRDGENVVGSTVIGEPSGRPWRVSHTATRRRLLCRRVAAGRRPSPVAASSGPWASRVSSGASPGSSPATAASPVSTSSGRTAGTACRSTRSSARARRSCGRDRQRRRPRARQSKLAQALLGHPLDEHLVGGEERRDRGRDLARPAPSSVDAPAAGLEQVGERPAGRLDHLERRRGRRAAPRRARRARRRGRRPRRAPISRYSASLADPVGRGAGVGDPRVRVEARGVGHRDPGPEDRPLEGAAEVAVAGEAQPAALGVADPQPLDGRGLLLGLFTHPERLASPLAALGAARLGGRRDLTLSGA